MASIDNLPLNLNPTPQAMRKLESVLRDLPEVEAYSPRIKFGGMFSNFTETTNIRLNGVYPEQEFRTVPLLPTRLKMGKPELKKGEIWIPELLARGMGVKIGDPVVIVATNQDGSVNGKQFNVSGVLESATGPGGRDGYVHIAGRHGNPADDGYGNQRDGDPDQEFQQIGRGDAKLEELLSKEVNPKGQPIFEVHSWEKLSPFYNIARMIEVMTFFIKLMLIAVVLISIMNVMIMAVYERIREIGTIAAIGTLPGKILSMFVMEGFCLGVIGVVAGNLVGLILILILNFAGLKFDFGMQKDLVLAATIAPRDLIVTSGIVILVAVIASLQPALKASRMEPIKALRHV